MMPPAIRFRTKEAARAYAWRELASRGAARPPLPVHGRIPNFEGAERAASRLFELEPWSTARCIKVSPDSPQAPVRLAALVRGITVYVPTPRLAGGFHRLDPQRIPATRYGDAAQLATLSDWSDLVALDRVPQMDAIVTGSVCVTAAGKRCGKGAGYSDIEYGILLELGHRPVPVATTVHETQWVDDFPHGPTDLPLSAIATPERTWQVAQPLASPAGICWTLLDEAALHGMPLLNELRGIRAEPATRADR